MDEGVLVINDLCLFCSTVQLLHKHFATNILLIFLLLALSADNASALYLNQLKNSYFR